MTVEEVTTGAPTFEKAPPQDVAAEQCVLGGMMLSKDAIADVVEILRVNDFYRPAHATIFDAILDLYGRGEPADAVVVAAHLDNAGELVRVGGAPYLHTLISAVPTAANAAYYARIVSERAVLRRLVEAGTKIVQLGYGSAAGAGRDVDDIVDLAQQAIYDVTERRVSEDFAILADMLQPTLDEIEAVGAQGGLMTGVPTGFTDLDRLLNGLQPGQLIVVAGRPGLGKALALDTPLATPTGWTTMGDVRVGERLIGADGHPTRVVAATEVMEGRPCFEVEFSDGSVIVADGSHSWLTLTRFERRSGRAGQVRTTHEIAETVRCATADRRLNHSVENASSLRLPGRDLPLPPYVLGVWLGDGHSAGNRITSADPEIVCHIEAEGLTVEPQGRMLYSLKLPKAEPIPERDCVVCGMRFQPKAANVRSCGRSCGGKARFVSMPVDRPSCASCGAPATGAGSGPGLCSRCWRSSGSVTARLRDLGLIDNKHIPMQYLRASERQRRDLLAGLLDTDGWVHRDGAVQFAGTNRRLVDDVRELIVSLGYRCQVTAKKVKGRTPATSVAYTITFSTADEAFRLERKRLAHKEKNRTLGLARCGSRFIVDLRRIPSVPVRCVQVDNDSHLYLAGRSMIPTHNSTVSMDFARNAAVRANLPSAIFSLEMSKVEIVMRLLSAEARVPLQVLRSGQLSDDDWTKLARRMGEISEAPIFVDDTPNMTLMEIRAKARRLKQRHDLKLIIVDYLQLMSAPRRVESRQQEVAELSRGLKLLAKEVECPVIAVSQLNRGPEQRTDKRPQLSDLRESGCLVAGTRVMRADTNAECTLGELLAAGARDVPVWALNERLKYTPATMTHVFPSGHREVFRLRLASGKTVDATGNHPFLTFNGWMPLSQLDVGSRVGSPRHVPPPLAVRRWPEDEIVMLAHLLGDGSFVRRQPIRYASMDEQNLEAVTKAAKHWGITAIRRDYEILLARERRNPVAEWLDGLGLFGMRSDEKFVPQGVFALPKEQVTLFLHHLWATDGSVTVLKNGRGGRIYFGSTSRRLLEDVSRLLLRFGITGLIRHVETYGHQPQYNLDIAGKDDQLRFLREVGVHGARQARCRALEAILQGISPNTNVDTVPRDVWDKIRGILTDEEISRERLGRIAEVLGSAELELHATNDLFWDQVVCIESLGSQDVFDATVLGRHNFIANGVAVHNSIEQDADVVILLHRDDYYDKESPRAGEADFIVAKHRNCPTDAITVAAQLHLSRFVDMAIV